MNKKEAITKALRDLDYREYGDDMWSKPKITILEYLNAICNHLDIYIVKEAMAIVPKGLPERAVKEKNE